MKEKETAAEIYLKETKVIQETLRLRLNQEGMYV